MLAEAVAALEATLAQINMARGDRDRVTKAMGKVKAAATRSASDASVLSKDLLLPVIPQPPMQQPLSSTARSARGLTAAGSTVKAVGETTSPVTFNSTSKEAPPTELNLGQVIAASLYLTVESLLVRMQADRISLYLTNEKSGDLQLAVNAGVGMPRPSRFAHPPLSTGILHSVISTGIAVSLPSVSLEDVADCQGPTRARNAIIFPIRNVPPKMDCIGAIIAVNRQRGTEPFGPDEERLLHMVLPSIAYIARQYPIDFGAFAFDFSALHRIVPLEPYVAPHIALPQGWVSPQTQLVYHRDGPEKFLRREALREGAEEVPDEGVANHVRSVQKYIATMESCWQASIVQSMELERQLRQRQALITDAQEILHRKQKKLDLLKDVLCEQLEQTGQPPSMALSTRVDSKPVRK